MEKTEELRQNWHIAEMQHSWKTRRQLAKKNADALIACFKEDKERKLKRLNEEHEVKRRSIEADFEVKVNQALEGLNRALREIAIDQDAYMHKFRNYVASLPKDEQADFYDK